MLRLHVYFGLQEGVAEAAHKAQDALKKAAHATGIDETLHRASQSAADSALGHKVADAAHAAGDKVSPEVKKYPVEFWTASGAAMVGLGFMLW